MKTYDENNIFAKILREEIPTTKIYEDEYAIAFHDINPKAPIHVLVLPKGAYTDFTDFSMNASPDKISGFFKAVAKVAQQLGITDNGYRIVGNIGKDGGQEVPHLHIHILAGKKLPL